MGEGKRTEEERIDISDRIHTIFGFCSQILFFKIRTYQVGTYKCIGIYSQSIGIVLIADFMLPASLTVSSIVCSLSWKFYTFILCFEKTETCVELTGVQCTVNVQLENFDIIMGVSRDLPNLILFFVKSFPVLEGERGREMERERERECVLFGHR